MDETHIRAARDEDVELLADYQLCMARETEGLALAPDTVRAGVAAVLEDPRRGRYWLAERDGQVVGALLTVPEWSDWRNGTVLWIHSVFVEPDHRRGGVYRCLYAHLQEMVEADPQLHGLRLYVDRRNHAAAAVYRSLGMDDQHYRLFEWLKD